VAFLGLTRCEHGSRRADGVRTLLAMREAYTRPGSCGTGIEVPALKG